MSRGRSWSFWGSALIVTRVVRVARADESRAKAWSRTSWDGMTPEQRRARTAPGVAAAAAKRTQEREEAMRLAAEEVAAKFPEIGEEARQKIAALVRIGRREQRAG